MNLPAPFTRFIVLTAALPTGIAEATDLALAVAVGTRFDPSINEID